MVLFHFTWLGSLLQWGCKVPIIKVIEILWYFTSNEKKSDLNMSLGKMSDFVSFPLFGFTLVIKLRNFDSESQWNTLTCFDKKDMLPDLIMSHGKMSDFVSLPLFRFTLFIKLKNFDFKGH